MTASRSAGVVTVTTGSFDHGFVHHGVGLVLLRFPVREGAFDRLDAGLRECLQAGKACTGYSINVRDVKRDRVGSFWSDALGFKRVVEVSGWAA